MDKLPYEQIEAWMPRLSGTAFKILIIVVRTLESRRIEEIRFGYGDLMKLTGSSRNTVIAAVEDLLRLELLANREDGGKFYYRRGAKIAPVQKLHPSKNRTRPKIAPRKLEERIFWQWKTIFGRSDSEIFTDARRRLLDQVLAELHSDPETFGAVYKIVLQSMRGYFHQLSGLDASIEFEKIFESKKSISKGVVLYVSWRTSKF